MIVKEIFYSEESFEVDLIVELPALQFSLHVVQHVEGRLQEDHRAILGLSAYEQMQLFVEVSLVHHCESKEPFTVTSKCLYMGDRTLDRPHLSKSLYLQVA